VPFDTLDEVSIILKRQESETIEILEIIAIALVLVFVCLVFFCLSSEFI
jgi:uncharacterized membrane protein YidH (DUF202 family)